MLFTVTDSHSLKISTKARFKEPGKHFRPISHMLCLLSNFSEDLYYGKVVLKKGKKKKRNHHTVEISEKKKSSSLAHWCEYHVDFI